MSHRRLLANKFNPSGISIDHRWILNSSNPTYEEIGGGNPMTVTASPPVLSAGFATTQAGNNGITSPINVDFTGQTIFQVFEIPTGFVNNITYGGRIDNEVDNYLAVYGNANSLNPIQLRVSDPSFTNNQIIGGFGVLPRDTKIVIATTIQSDVDFPKIQLFAKSEVGTIKSSSEINTVDLNGVTSVVTGIGCIYSRISSYRSPLVAYEFAIHDSFIPESEIETYIDLLLS